MKCKSLKSTTLSFRVCRASADSERGSALVEAAFVIPFLLIVCFGIADFYFAISSYFNINHAAREAAVAAASLPRIKVANLSGEQSVSINVELNTLNYEECMTEASEGEPQTFARNCIASFMGWRIGRVLLSDLIRDCDVDAQGCSQVGAYSSYSDSASGLDNKYKYNIGCSNVADSSCRVKVNVTAKYRPFFNVLGGVKMSATASSFYNPN